MAKAKNITVRFLFKSTKEEPHKKWDKTKDRIVEGQTSARCYPVGYEKQIDDWKSFNFLHHIFGNSLIQVPQKTIVLIDKVIMPIDKCPRCGSTNTFHKRLNKLGNPVGNVYADKKIEEDNGRVYMKFDYCFACSKKFLIEMFIWKDKEQ